MPKRLNRRRYRECVIALKELISDSKAPSQRRLLAVQTLLEIYRRHDESESRRERRAQAAAQTVPDTEQSCEPVTEPPSIDDAESAALEFLQKAIGELSTNE